MNSFHDWSKGKWTILLTLPRAFTSVCTSELAMLARVHPQLEALSCQVATLTTDSVATHHAWINDVIEFAGGDISIDFPIIADPVGEISAMYGMADPLSCKQERIQFTFR